MKSTSQTAGQTATTILADMRVALGAARKLNNKKPISADFVAGNPLCKNPKAVYTAWVGAITDIYKVIQPWAIGFNDANVTNETLENVYAKVCPMWTALNNDVDPKMFVRTNDVHRLLSFSLRHGSTLKGSIDVEAGLTNFRKEVETMMGIRIAQSAVLTNDEYELITKVDKATANLEKAENRLNGYTDAKGQHVDGLQDKLETAKDALKNAVEMAIKLGVPKKDIEENPLFKPYTDDVEAIENDITKTKKKIADYKVTIKENSKEYDKIMAKVNEIK